jgi:hypothetical protein
LVKEYIQHIQRGKKLNSNKTNKQKPNQNKKPNSKRTSNPFNKWANELNRQFSEEEIQIIT